MHPKAPGGIVPRVFVSYSHETVGHKDWVKQFATRLRENAVDTILDQWDLVPGEDLTTFMESNLKNCDFAILVCTTTYVEKANKGVGGVGYERMIVTGEMLKSIDQRKFIPIVRQSGTQLVPIFLSTKRYTDFSNDDEFEIALDDVLRAIFKQAISVKPPLGERPLERLEKLSSSLTNDSGLSNIALRAFTAIVQQYDERGEDWHRRTDIAFLSSLGHVAMTVAVDELKAKTLIRVSPDTTRVAITTHGAKTALALGIASSSRSK